MARLDHARQVKLEPERINFAVNEIQNLGFKIIYRDRTKTQFHFKGSIINYYPYSGWHTGKSIKDGRGWENLKKQIT